MTKAMSGTKEEKWEKSLSWFDDMIDQSYNEKLKYAKSKIREAIERYGDKVAVACSWGKDSTVLTHMARKIKPDIKVVFCNTGVEYKGCLRFRDKYLEKYDVNYFEIQPKKTFFDIKEEMEEKHSYDSWWPTFRGGKNRETGKKTGKPRCCYWLKEKPMGRFVEEHNLRSILIGTLAEESYNRKWVTIRYGDDYKTDKDFPYEVHKFLPLSFWVEEEIWKYIDDHNIPHNVHYDTFDRNGCVVCTAHIGWKKQMGKYSPKLLQMVLKDMNEQSNFNDFEETGGAIE